MASAINANGSVSPNVLQVKRPLDGKEILAMPLIIARLQQVESALVSLYTDADPQRKSAADKWLNEFQQTFEAWRVADQLLLVESLPDYVHFFAAQTLHAKIKYDMHELPADALVSLRDSLTSHILRLRGSSKPTVTRLCVALASLAVQMEQWTGVVPFIVNAFRSAPGTTTPLLELLTVLPEELFTHNYAITPQRQELLQKELSSSAGDVLRLLVEIMQSSSSANSSSLQSHVLRSMTSWVSFCEVPADALVQNPLLGGTFEALARDELFDDAVEVLVAVLRIYNDLNVHGNVVGFVVPRIMQLKAMYIEAVGTEDDETCRGLCRVFTEMAESYLPLILGEQDVQQLDLLDIILRCTSHSDPDVSGITLNFWYHFTASLQHLEPKEHQNARMQVFAPVLSRLQTLCIEMLEFPEDVESWKPDRHDDFKNFRQEISDTLLDCSRLLGAQQCLKHCLTKLQTGMEKFTSGGEWFGIEAALHGVRAIAREIPATESEVLPVLMPLVPQLPTHPAIRYTGTLVVGRYSEWLDAHSQYLLPLFFYVVGGIPLTDPRWNVSSAAAMAVKSICRDCGQHLGEGVLQVYDQAPAMHLRDELELLDGLCRVLSQVSVQAAESSLRRLVGPIARRLKNLLADTSTGSKKDVMDDVKRLTAIFQSACPRVEANQPHPIAVIVGELWPLLQEIFHVYKDNAAVAETGCRFFKHTMRSCRAHFSPLLEQLVTLLIQSYQAHPISSYLYCGSICITEFGYESQYKGLFLHMLNNFSSTTFQLLNSLPQFTNNPDIVVEYFYLIDRCAVHFRDGLIESQLLTAVVQCGIVGLSIQHQEANKAVLTCLEAILQMGLRSSGKGSYTVYQPTIEALMATEGQKLISAVMEGVMGSVPINRVKSQGRGSLSRVIQFLAELNAHKLQEMLYNILAKIPDNILTNEEKTEFLQDLFTAANEDDFQKVVYNFSHIYRGRTSRFRS